LLVTDFCVLATEYSVSKRHIYSSE